MLSAQERQLQDARNLNTVAVILMISFALALIIVGILLVKTNIFKSADKNRAKGKKRERAANTPPSPVDFIGKIMIILGSMIALIGMIIQLLNISGRL